MALLYEDYRKLRNTKVGETVVLSIREEVKKKQPDDHVNGKRKPTKNCNLDFYDGSYIG